jgi:Transposase
VDELHDGAFTVLSLVDNHRFGRLAYQVLEHKPTEADVQGFFERFGRALTRCGGSVRGVSSDGSWLYPGPIAQVFGPIPHQLCRFHILQDLTRQALHAVAALRKRLAASAPKLPRGRVPPGKEPELRQSQRIAAQVADLYQHRHLFVRRRLTPAQHQRLRQVSRGQPQLRTLRRIMDRVYGLFDRRCRSGTARAKLQRLRQEVSCFPELRGTLKKLFSEQFEQALSFLDDRQLPATSNAVERANRRHRKMQKTIYRVRTAPTLRGRIALDLQRGRCNAKCVNVER